MNIILIGFAAFYVSGLMEHVATVRNIPYQPCMVAMDMPLGTKVVLQHGTYTYECIVIDVPHPDHIEDIKARDIIIELPYNIHKQICNLVQPKHCRVSVMVILHTHEEYERRQ